MHIKNSTITTLDLGAGVQRKIMAYNDDMMIAKFYFETNAVGALHQHLHSQCAYVAKGKFEVSIDGKTELLEEGDVYFINPNIIHGVICVEQGILVDIFNPKRNDFL